MISVYQLKPKFQYLLRPLVKKLFDKGITANQVTVIAMLGSVLIALVMVLLIDHNQIFWLMPIWMLIRMALNAIDGMLAREFDQKSNLGTYLNELGDVISDSALLFVFTCVNGVSSSLVVLVIILSLLTEYAAVIGALIGASRCYDGPMGKSDRALIFSVMSIGMAIDCLSAKYMNLILVVVAVLLVYTVVNRIKNGIKQVA